MHRPVRALYGILVLSLVACQARPAFAQTSRGETKSNPSSVVNLNTATSAELQTLPGIGAKTAERIIEYRQKNGGFKKVEDLMNVRGIGEKSFLKLKSQVTIAPAKPDRSGTPNGAAR